MFSNDQMKLDCILLIDDDTATNFINQHVIKSFGVDAKIKAFESGSTALDYLSSSLNKQSGIILLDINMPGMNGWEFLDEYEKMSPERRSKIILAMLSTSVNPDDEQKAKQRSSVEKFISKPLKKEHIDLLIKQASLL